MSNGIYDDLYGEAFSHRRGSFWAYASVAFASSDGQETPTEEKDGPRTSIVQDHDGNDDLFCN